MADSIKSVDTVSNATLRIEARFKNARLFNAILAVAILPTSHGRTYGPIKSWCHAHNLCCGVVHGLLNLRVKPVLRNSRVRPICARIAALLNDDISYLFPADLYQIRWPSLATETDHEPFMLQLSAVPRVMFQLPPQHEDQYIARQMTAALDSAIDQLTPSEAAVVRARFGLNGDDEQTRDVIGAKMGFSQQRIHQIEVKALNKLRHPSRSKLLKHWLG